MTDQAPWASDPIVSPGSSAPAQAPSPQTQPAQTPQAAPAQAPWASDPIVSSSEKQPDPDAPGVVQAALLGAADGITFGWSDEIAGRIHQMGGADYTEARDAHRKLQDDAREAHPVAYTSGMVAGSIAPFLIAPEAAAPATVSRAVALGAGMGALRGAGNAAEMSDVPHEALIGGVVGASIPGVISAASKLGPLADAVRSSVTQPLFTGATQKIAGTLGMGPVLQKADQFVSSIPGVSALGSSPVSGAIGRGLALHGVGEGLTGLPTHFLPYADAALFGLGRAGDAAGQLSRPAVMSGSLPNLGADLATGTRSKRSIPEPLIFRAVPR